MIEFKSVSKKFGDQPILEDVSFQINEGEKWCVIGQSGSGKSVTMKLMTGLLKPDSGQVIINGEDTTRFSTKDWARVLTDVGVVFQGAALFSGISIFENVAIRLLEERKIAAPEIKSLAKEALMAVGLKPEEVLSKYPSELSGGMQKRVGVARAIIHRPKILFYDEPTTGLDPISAGKVDELIDELAKTPGRTSIIITHDMYMVKTIASRVLFIHDRKIHFCGTPEQLMGSQDPVIQAFLMRKI